MAELRPSATAAPCPIANALVAAQEPRACDVFIPGGPAPPCPPAQQVPLRHDILKTTGLDASPEHGALVQSEEWDEDVWVSRGIAWAQTHAPGALAANRDAGESLVARHSSFRHSLVQYRLESLLGEVATTPNVCGWRLYMKQRGQQVTLPFAVTDHNGLQEHKLIDAVNVSRGCPLHRAEDAKPSDRIWRRVGPGVLAPVAVPSRYPAVERGGRPEDAAPTKKPQPRTRDELDAVLTWPPDLSAALAQCEQGSDLWLWARKLFTIGGSSVSKVQGHSYVPAREREKFDPNNTGACPAHIVRRQQDDLLRSMLWGSRAPPSHVMKWGTDHEPCADECIDGLYALRDADAGLPPDNHAVLHLGIVKNSDVCPYVAVRVDGVSLTGRIKPGAAAAASRDGSAAPPAPKEALPPHVWATRACFAEAGLIEHKCPQRFYPVIPPAYFDQIQLCMAVMRLPYADFTMWRPEGFVCQRYAFDEAYVTQALLPAVAHFYETRFIPALLAMHAGNLPQGEIVYTPLFKAMTPAQLQAFAERKASERRGTKRAQAAAPPPQHAAGPVTFTMGGITMTVGEDSSLDAGAAAGPRAMTELDAALAADAALLQPAPKRAANGAGQSSAASAEGAAARAAGGLGDRLEELLAQDEAQCVPDTM